MHTVTGSSSQRPSVRQARRSQCSSGSSFPAPMIDLHHLRTCVSRRLGQHSRFFVSVIHDSIVVPLFVLYSAPLRWSLSGVTHKGEKDPTAGRVTELAHVVLLYPRRGQGIQRASIPEDWTRFPGDQSPTEDKVPQCSVMKDGRTARPGRGLCNLTGPVFDCFPSAEGDSDVQVLNGFPSGATSKRKLAEHRYLRPPRQSDCQPAYSCWRSSAVASHVRGQTWPAWPAAVLTPISPCRPGPTPRSWLWNSPIQDRQTVAVSL